MRITICNIYCLINPFDKSVFYVGRTYRKLKDRLRGHISESKRKESLKNEIINDILKRGSAPTMVLLEIVKPKTRFSSKPGGREKYWIRRFTKTSSITNIVMNPLIWTKEYRDFQYGSKNKKSIQ